MAKVNKGKMACETCGNQVTVKVNENNTLSYRCDECDASPYAKLGTLQHVHWSKKMITSHHDETAAAKVPEVKKQVENVWGL